MATCCVPCEVRTELLNTVYTSYGSKVTKMYLEWKIFAAFLTDSRSILSKGSYWMVIINQDTLRK